MAEWEGSQLLEQKRLGHNIEKKHIYRCRVEQLSMGAVWLSSDGAFCSCTDRASAPLRPFISFIVASSMVQCIRHTALAQMC